MYLFPQWFWVVVYSTRTFLGRSEREKLLGATIQSVSASKLLSYIEDNLQVDEDGEQLNRTIGQESVKWIVNLDLDYFFIQVMMVTFKYCQMNTSEYWLKNLEIASIVLMC